MPRFILTAPSIALALACFAAPAAAQQTEPAPAVTAADSLGQLARELRAERVHAASVHVYTNRTIPAQGTVSSVGPAAAAQAGGRTAPRPAAVADQAQQEASWRQKFATARQQLTLDQQQLDVTQREFNLSQMQYYSNPNQALQQQHSRTDLDQQQTQIASLKAKVAADQQAITDLEEQLREAGLPPGWSQ